MNPQDCHEQSHECSSTATHYNVASRRSTREPSDMRLIQQARGLRYANREPQHPDPSRSLSANIDAVATVAKSHLPYVGSCPTGMPKTETA